MEENQLWAVFWRSVACVLAAVAACVAGCSAHRDHVAMEMIKSGASPVQIACSLGRDNSKEACLISSMREGN